MKVRNTEPTVEELLADPVARLLMARDGLQPGHVWACVRAARQKRSARETLGRAVAAQPVSASATPTTGRRDEVH